MPLPDEYNHEDGDDADNHHVVDVKELFYVPSTISPIYYNNRGFMILNYQ